MKIFIDVGMSSSGYRLSGIVFIKLLMVRGSFSASFPVIAVRFSPTFIKDNARVSKEQKAGVLKVENTGVDQAWKKGRGAGMDPVAVAIQVSRGGRAAPVLSSCVITGYCCY